MGAYSMKASNQAISSIINKTFNHDSTPRKGDKSIDLNALRKNSAEEISAGIVKDHSKEEKTPLSKKRNLLQIKKRIEKIESIRSIEKFIIENDKIINLSRNLSDNAHSEKMLHDALSKEYNESPFYIYASIKKSLKDFDVYSEEFKRLNLLKGEILNQKSTPILSWIHSVEKISNRISDSALVKSLLDLIGKSNEKKSDVLTILYSIINISGKKDFSAVSSAYIGAIRDDVDQWEKNKVSSTEIGYLSELLKESYRFHSARTIFFQADTIVEEINSKYTTLNVSLENFLQSFFELVKNPEKENLDFLSLSVMGPGEEKSYDFLLFSRNLLKDIEKSIIKDDEKLEINKNIDMLLYDISKSLFFSESNARDKFNQKIEK